MREVQVQVGTSGGKFDTTSPGGESRNGVCKTISDIQSGLFCVRVVRFVLVGVFGAFVELGLFSVLLAAKIGVVLSNVVAFHVAFALCFALHYVYTHQYPFSGWRIFLRGFVRYAALMYGQLAFGTILLWLLIDKTGLVGEVAKLVQIAIGTPLGYLIQKNLIFQRSGA
jgi:putative flippase GtrA